MRTWEYLLVELSDYRHVKNAWLNGAPFSIPNKPMFGGTELSSFLEYLGNMGWEMAGNTFPGTLIFKRPKN